MRSLALSRARAPQSASVHSSDGGSAIVPAAVLSPSERNPHHPGGFLWRRVQPRRAMHASARACAPPLASDSNGVGNGVTTPTAALGHARRHRQE